MVTSHTNQCPSSQLLVHFLFFACVSIPLCVCMLCVWRISKLTTTQPCWLQSSWYTSDTFSTSPYPLSYVASFVTLPPPFTISVHQISVFAFKCYAEVRWSCFSFCAWMLSLSIRAFSGNGRTSSFEGYSAAHLPHFLYPHIHLQILQLFPHLATANSDAVNVVCGLLHNTDFLSFAYTYPGAFW